MPAAASVVQRASTVLLMASVALVLSACVDDPVARPEPSATSSPTETATPEPSSEPSDEPAALDIPCGDLVDPDAVYAFNPNFALLGEWTPDAGSAAADALDADGVACRWVLESGGGTMDISAARLTDDEILDLKNEAFASSQMVPTYGDEAYFEVEDGVGTAIVFQGPFWLVATSEAFFEPGEPTEMIDSALAALTALPAP